MSVSYKIAVTGATGQLGRLIVADLLQKVPAHNVVAIVRNPDAAKDIAEKGVDVRVADYDDATALNSALQGVGRLVFVSASEVGKRVPQHRNIIEAAKAAGMKLVAYTSLLHADSTPLPLAPEHRETEAMLKASGLNVVILRNGWYTENYLGSVGAALEHGATIGAAGEGKVASATRADFAAAAAAVITSNEDQAGKTYELAGDSAYSLSELAAEISRQSGKPVVYNDMPQNDYAKALESFGLPAPFAAMLAECDALAKDGALFSDSKALSTLIGRPTTTLETAVASALGKN